ncbi:hypothetical protein VPH35_128867 [Triticum aestivum]|uniref:Uncharacterized protein n=1 Tax=Triticum turgidum subsp. durum TaxID=4567 RepID=A0A9R1BZS2_TRITD|nr:unnamed protein product [Triticum turgidum subsp. durum]
MTSTVADAVSSSHAFLGADRSYHHHHHWGRPLIEMHLRQIERRLTTLDLDSGSISGASDVADALLLLCNKAGHLKDMSGQCHWIHLSGLGYTRFGRTWASCFSFYQFTST